MANYNIYGIVRKDIEPEEFIYIGQTGRMFEERWQEHRLAVGDVYKRSGSWGQAGEARNPLTLYGEAAAKPLYNFIRSHLGSIPLENDKWEFIELGEDGDELTEDAWISIALYAGHKLFNMKRGEGEFVTENQFSHLDLEGVSSPEEVIAIDEAYSRAMYETLQGELVSMYWKDYVTDYLDTRKSLKGYWKNIGHIYHGLMEAGVPEDVFNDIENIFDGGLTYDNFDKQVCKEYTEFDAYDISKMRGFVREKRRLWAVYFRVVKWIVTTYNIEDLYMGERLD